MINNIYFKIVKNITLIITITIITFSSLVSIYEKREKISDLLRFKFFDGYKKISADDYRVAHDIQKKGGYILFFRHGHREKWIDVNMYDAYDATNNLKAENEYYEYAVCLSDMGKIQAKMMGDNLKKINLPIEKVYSSPSCRARQTADLVFGGYNETKHVYLHFSYYENRDIFNKRLKKELLRINVPENKNVIITGHNSVISETLFDEFEKKPIFKLEEGGFYAFKKLNNKLIFIHKFNNFEHFSINWYPRPKD